MTPIGSDRRLATSVLDRLIDLEPRNSLEASERAARTLADIRRAIRRDLEWLLNSRRTPVGTVAGEGRRVDSVCLCGLADISYLGVSSPNDRDRLRGIVGEAVARFEPRLTGVVVTLDAGVEGER